MGQLIKLQDYISRYEEDLAAYTTRFILFKRRRWERLKQWWESAREAGAPGAGNRADGDAGFSPPPFPEESVMAQRPGRLAADPGTAEKSASLEALKKAFLNDLFELQIKWASSTAAKISYVDRSYYRDGHLKFLMQRFPDTFLCLYKPVFLLKKAPVEAEIVLITPVELLCLSFLEEEEDAIYIASSEKFWLKRSGEREEKIVNPFLALNRTEAIVRRLLKEYGIGFPVTKTVVASNGYIDYPSASFGQETVDRLNYESWFQRLRNLRSPLKHEQLKAARALLRHCHSVYLPRQR